MHFPLGVTYCKNDSNPTPVINGLGGGVFTESGAMWFVGDQGYSLTGKIDLDLSPPGTFVVSYDPRTGCDAVHNVSVTIQDTTSTNLDYPNVLMCQGNGLVNPLVGGSTPGTFPNPQGIFPLGC